MIWILRLSKFLHVASRTIWKNAILPADHGLVARFAFDSGVRSDQRKQVVVVANLLLRCEPALHNVALGAIRSELAQMNVRVAIVAILSNLAEHSVRVALRARQVCVPPSQRKVRLTIVIEPGMISDGTPRGSGVTTFAWNRQPAMRIHFLCESESREGANQNCTGKSLKNNKGNACQRPGRSFLKSRLRPWRSRGGRFHLTHPFCASNLYRRPNFCHATTPCTIVQLAHTQFLVTPNSSASSVRQRCERFQPTISRVQQSITHTRYAQPTAGPAQIFVMSDCQI